MTDLQVRTHPRRRHAIEAERAGGGLLAIHCQLVPEQQPGLIERTLLAPTDRGEVWVDTARWRSPEEALAAAEAFARELAHADFETMLDPGTVQMLHLEPVDLG